MSRAGPGPPARRALLSSPTPPLNSPFCQALALLAAAPGVSLINDRAANRFPTPLDASNQDDVFVGRVR